MPIYQTTRFVFDDTDDAAALFALQKYGNVYSRLANPTVAAFEERIASLEGGLGAVATAQRARPPQFITFAALAGAGDHIVASANLYGGTLTQLDVHAAPVRRRDDVRAAASTRPTTRRRSPTARSWSSPRRREPVRRRRRPRGLAEVAHAAGVPLVVDATIATPYLCRPLEYGADIVLHSATKFLGGHGTTLGGVVVESGRFHWGNGSFPDRPSRSPTYGGLSWRDNFGEYAFLHPAARRAAARHRPGALAALGVPAAQGVETLPLRMEAHVRNARIVAEWLEPTPRSPWVH